jgi:AsmA protein
MRKVALAVGIIILIIVVAAVVFAATFNVNKYRGTIQSELEKRLGRQVTLGDMHLSVFPPRFRVQNLAIADDPRLKSEKPFVQAQELDVAVKLLPLLHKSVEVSSLNLQRPTVELIKNPQGVWNFASIGATQEQNAPTPAEKQPQPAKPSAGKQTSQAPQPTAGESQKSEQLALDRLVIQDGQVAITDQQAKTPRTVYDHIDVTLKNFTPNEPFTLDAAAHLPGSGAQEVRLQGDGGPVVQGQPAATPFRGTLSLKQVGVADLSKFLNSPALVNTDGTLSGETKIVNEGGKLTASGQTNIQNAKIHGIDLGYPIAAQYDVTDELLADMLTVRNTTIKLGPTPLFINGTVNSKGTPAQLNLNLKANNVSIAEMAKLAATSGMALTPGTTVTGNVNADITARGPADKPALNGTVNGSNIQLSGKEAPQPVQIPAINLNLTPAQIQSNNFNVVSGGTTVNAQFALRNYLAKTPLVDATLKAPNATLPALLSMAKAYGVKGVDKINGAGTLNLDMHAAGPVRAISSDEIMKALNGALNLNFNNVKYSGADINHELASIAGFLNKSNTASQGFTNILRMTGNVLVKNGIAQTNNLQALLDLGNLGVAGTANLVTQELNLHATAVLSKDFTQKIGGNSVGGFMQTALANNQGELVIPALITGTFLNPRFAPDVQQVAQMKLKGVVPNFNNPAGAVSGLLGNLLGQQAQQQKNQQQQSQETQQQQENPVQQLIGIFGKKKQQQQQPQPPPK